MGGLLEGSERLRLDRLGELSPLLTYLASLPDPPSNERSGLELSVEGRLCWATCC